MTAEVAILNKEAVALAADSAATLSGNNGQQKITYANKVFALSKYHPVGIMIYGGAYLMSVPWETIIKDYRKALGGSKFNTLKEYGDDLLKYLKKNTHFYPESEQKKYVLGHINGYFEHINEMIHEELEDSFIKNKNNITNQEIKNIVDSVIEYHYKLWKETKSTVSNSSIIARRLRTKYLSDINKIKREVFEKLPLSRIHLNHLIEIAISLFLKFPEGIGPDNQSGVVIAGFGEKDIFPSIVSYTIEGVPNNYLKYKNDRYLKINFSTGSMIVPFAQADMVHTFMNGIHPLYEREMDKLMAYTLEHYPEVILDNIKGISKKQKDSIKKKLIKIGIEKFRENKKSHAEFKKNRYNDPILTVVSFLPKHGLAEMAESLVNLTSFKKRVSMGDETVGGPIDVAVISKGDGLIWIKRKHYFEPGLNAQYFSNYFPSLISKKNEKK